MSPDGGGPDQEVRAAQGAGDELPGDVEPSIEQPAFIDRDGRILADQGAAAALHSTHPAWAAAAEAALMELAAEGRPFSAEDLRGRVPMLGGHENGLGGLFRRAARRGYIEACGVVEAKRPEARGRLLRQWRGAP